MILKNLPDHPCLTFEKWSLNDHVIFYDEGSSSGSWDADLPAPGILAFQSGSGSIMINDQHVSVDESSFLVMNRGSNLRLKISNKRSKLLMLVFNADLAEFLSENLLNKIPMTTTHDLHNFTLVEHIHYKNATLKEQFNLLICLGDSCASFHALKADMVIRSILDNLILENYNAIRISESLQVVKQSTRTDLYKRLTMAKDWMENNYSSADLAQAANISMLNAQHFLRLFKQAFGITPNKHLASVRVQRAAVFLKTTDHPVTVVCQKVGFESVASFSTLFKKHFGISPARYRMTMKLI
jgi:AraC-like DNA-binding protein